MSLLTTSSVRITLSQNIRRIRRERAWSQQYLSTRAGLHCTEISRLERNLREPRITTVVAVARALDVSIDELLKEHQ